MKKLFAKSTLCLLLTGFTWLSNTTVAIAQEATSAISEPTPIKDTRTIAEWSSFSGTQIFTILMIIMLALIISLVVLSDVIKNILKSDKFKNRIKDKYTKTLLMIIGFSLIGNVSNAATSAEANSFIQLSDTTFWALVSINVVLLLVVLYMLNFLKWILREINPKPEGAKIPDTWWSRIMKKMTDAVPVEEESVVMTDHEYDGIRELDNNLPPWWVYGFYLTIVFAIVYLFHFHIFKTGDLQAAEYDKEMIRADMEVEAYLKSQANNVDEFNAVVLTDKAALAGGKEIFEANCKTCHKSDGGGQTGPNLTDDYWIHGGDIKDLFKTIKYGVTSKSMPVWKDQLTPIQIQEVASYIKSLRGTNPPGGLGPQGDLYTEKAEVVEEIESEETVSSDSTIVNDTLQ